MKFNLKDIPTTRINDEIFYRGGRFVLLKESFVQLYSECLEKCGIASDELPLSKLIKTNTLYQILMSLGSTTGRTFCTAEFGVFKGVSSMLITSILADHLKKHYIFDSFEGLSKPTKEDIDGSSNPVSGGEMSPELEHIKNLFPTCILQKCWIPDQLQRVDALFDFVHIDLDLYIPILGALEYLIDKTNSGCVIVVDDYNERFPGCIKAIGEHVFKYQNLYHFHYDTMNGSYVLIKK